MVITAPSQPGRGCLAVLLSALVLPGAGQWLQRRRGAGAAFAAAFLMAFGWAVHGFWLLFANLRANLDDLTTAPPAPGVLLRPVLIPVGVALAVAVLSVADLVLAARRGKPLPPATRE